MSIISREQSTENRVQAKGRNSLLWGSNFLKSLIFFMKQKKVCASLKNMLNFQSKSFAKLYFCFLSSVFCFLLAACDWHGPWEYYPEETKVYQGVYTHGYIIAGRSAHVCFSKVYELDEASAENFAFYDSASVTVSGKFADIGEAEWSLFPVAGKPNCFGESSDELAFGLGIAGESYTMNATFKWDSCGHKITSTYKAVAKIPTKISANSVQGPSTKLKNDNPHVKNNHEYIDFGFVEYPNDMYTYNIGMDYDESVHGILMTLRYDNINDGESQKTTIVNMLSAFIDSGDSMGYSGVSMKRPDETTASMGFTARMKIGGYNSLDTMAFPGFTLPIGKSVVYFYATDQAYADYKEKVLEALEDPRIVPVSNVENGMGVFSGMLMDSLLFDIHTDEYVKYDYMFEYQCFNEDDIMELEPFDTKSCRLVRDSICLDRATGGVPLYNYYGTYSYSDGCASTILKMFLDEYDYLNNNWMPDYSEKKFQKYADEAWNMYCIEHNFYDKSACASIKEMCLESDEKNDCNKLLWEWCSDRDWDIETYEQCGPALISRIKIEKLKSPILDRVVSAWCKEHPENSSCKK